MTTLHDFTAANLTGQEISLREFDGRVVLVVNTASKCGLTPQLEGLQELFTTYHDQGLEIIGFPCNQFAGQEPLEGDGVAEFCSVNYGVTFTMMEKVNVNGKDAHPVWKWLREEKGGLLGNAIKWNFTKFLIGRDGHVIERFSPQTKPADLTEAIEKALAG